MIVCGMGRGRGMEMEEGKGGGGGGGGGEGEGGGESGYLERKYSFPLPVTSIETDLDVLGNAL